MLKCSSLVLSKDMFIMTELDVDSVFIILVLLDIVLKCQASNALIRGYVS